MAGWRAELAFSLPAERALDVLAVAIPQLLLGLATLRLGRTPRLCLGALGWLAAGAWALHLPEPAPPAAEARSAGPDLVLITLDTFRADHLGVAGGPVPTPALDAFSAKGVRFRNAVSTAPLTAPAHASMLTGEAPHDHGVRQNGQTLAVDSVVTRLQAAGWSTGAFLSSSILDASYGFAQGFDHFDDRFDAFARMEWAGSRLLTGSRAGQRRGDETVERALRWWEVQGGARFLWVHLYDAHAPYLPPPDWRPSPEAIAEAAAEAKALARPVQGGREWRQDLMRRQARGQALLYASEVEWVDHLVGQLLERVPEGAWVIIVGDHGESLGEHGYYSNHGANLFEPSVHVPLLLRGPGVEPGVSDALVSVQDVAQTLLIAAGLEQGAPFPGRDEVILATTGQQQNVGQGRAGPSTAARRNGAKLVVGEEAAWYDLGADPGELSPSPPPTGEAATAARLAELRDSFVAPLAPEERRRLEALGYVEGAAQAP